jgi:ABC-2 type transport system permease protein
MASDYSSQATSALPFRVGEFAHLCVEEARRQFINQIRYPLNFVMRFVVMLILFSAVFFGGQAIGGPSFSESLSGIVVGFFLWSLASTAFQSLSSSITGEARLGMLEHLFMSVHGIKRVITAKAIAQLFFNSFYSVVFLVIMLVVSGETLNLDLLTLLPVLALTLSSVVGAGLALAGLALLYKQIGSLLSFVQFIFLGLISAPEMGIWWSRIFPLAQGSAMTQEIMRDGMSLLDFPVSSVALLVGTGVGYLVLGYVILGLAVNRAQKLGVLGEY